MIIVIPIGENNPNETINTRSSQVSSVYQEDMNGDVSDFESSLEVTNTPMTLDPEIPVYENTTGFAWGVYVSGDYAYVADDLSGLAVIDISNPTNPGTPVYESFNKSAHCVYVSGNYAYITYPYGLAVIDVSDPTNPGTPI